MSKLANILWPWKLIWNDSSSVGLIIFLHCRFLVFHYLIMMNYYFIGVKGVQVEELWSLDAEQFENLKYVCFFYIFVFCRLLTLEGLRHFHICCYVSLFLYADLSMGWSSCLNGFKMMSPQGPLFKTPDWIKYFLPNR